MPQSMALGQTGVKPAPQPVPTPWHTVPKPGSEQPHDWQPPRPLQACEHALRGSWPTGVFEHEVPFVVNAQEPQLMVAQIAAVHAAFAHWQLLLSHCAFWPTVQEEPVATSQAP